MIDLNPIKNRLQAYAVANATRLPSVDTTAHLLAQEVPSLVAEIEELRRLLEPLTVSAVKVFEQNATSNMGAWGKLEDAINEVMDSDACIVSHEYVPAN